MAIFASGYPVVRGGYYSARNWSLNIDLLMGTAIVVATGIGYFIEAGTLAVLFSIAELLEDPTDSLNPGNLGDHFDKLERTGNNQYLVIKKERRTYRYELQRLEQ